MAVTSNFSPGAFLNTSGTTPSVVNVVARSAALKKEYDLKSEVPTPKLGSCFMLCNSIWNVKANKVKWHLIVKEYCLLSIKVFHYGFKKQNGHIFF